MMGSLARASHQTSTTNIATPRGMVVRTRGSVQGTMFPPAFRPSSTRTRNPTVKSAPPKSMRASSDLLETLGGMSTRYHTKIPDATITGTWMRNASRHPKADLSLMTPPSTPPSIAPDPYAIFPTPCTTPLFFNGTKSDAKNVLILINPPPPTPAMTRPRIIPRSSVASPHTRFPSANMALLNTKPGPRPKMSVSRPDSGWKVALAIR